MQIVRRAAQILAPLRRGLGVGRVGEVSRIGDPGLLLLAVDLAVEIFDDPRRLGLLVPEAAPRWPVLPQES